MSNEEPINATGPSGDLTADNRYLIFRIATETFATPLLSIREIVVPLAYKKVPNPYSYFVGLANLRGQIIGVLDLGLRFDLLPVGEDKSGALLIFESQGGMMGGLVHQVEHVMIIEENAIVHEHLDGSKRHIPSAAFGGIAKTADRLLPILNLSALAASDFKVPA